MKDRGVVNSVKITVITVCFHSKDSIEDTIRSVVEQYYAELEYIIIDGGSTDGTVDLIHKYKEYIAHFCSEADEGIYDAMNKGLCYATGEVVAFLNSGDQYRSGTLSRAAEYFKTDTLDILAGEVKRRCNGYMLPTRKKYIDPEELHFYMIYCHQGLFIRRKVFDTLGGYNTHYKLAADYELTLRAHNAGFIFKKVADVFADYDVDGVSQMRCYQCTQEFKEIALQNTGEHGESLLKQIPIRLNMDSAFQQNIINLVCKKDSNYLSSFFGGYSYLYIWGTGEIGSIFLELLLRSGIYISGFIDSYHYAENKWNFPVFNPDHLTSDSFVCIGTQKYEDEIIRQLEFKKFEKKQFITYTDFVDKILRYGRDKYSDYILNGCDSGGR